MKKTLGQFQRTVEVGNEEQSDCGTLDFPDLCAGDDNAHVAANIGYALNFSRGKSSVTVSLRCDQKSDVIDRAGDMALSKADELAVEGLRMAQARIAQLISEGMDIG